MTASVMRSWRPRRTASLRAWSLPENWRPSSLIINAPRKLQWSRPNSSWRMPRPLPGRISLRNRLSRWLQFRPAIIGFPQEECQGTDSPQWSGSIQWAQEPKHCLLLLSKERPHAEQMPLSLLGQHPNRQCQRQAL
jgi:hypothetical protein